MKKSEKEKWRDASKRFYYKNKNVIIDTVEPAIEQSTKKTEDKDKIIKNIKKRNRHLETELKKLNDNIQIMKRKMKSMKKQVYRLKKRLRDETHRRDEKNKEAAIIPDNQEADILENQQIPTESTPRKQTEEFLKTISEKDREVVRTQIFQLNALTAALQSQYKTMNYKEKNVLKMWSITKSLRNTN